MVSAPLRVAVLAAFAAATLAAGCTQIEWTSPAATPEQTQRALSDCRRQSQPALQRELSIETDIMTTRSDDWRRSGSIGVRREQAGARGIAREDELVAACMRAKGFYPGNAGEAPAAPGTAKE